MMNENENLPDFFIGGAAKSGTTSLWRYMKQHSRICIPSKEINFLNRHYDKGLDWYREHFQPCSRDVLIGDASVSTLADAEITAPRIADLLPEAKLIVILRDPIDRAYSAYWQYVRGEFLRHRKPTAQLFEDLVMGREFIPCPFPPSSNPEMGLGERIVKQGMYFDQLTEFFQRISREHVRIYIFDDFCKKEEKVVQDAFEFLGVDTEPIDTTERYKSGRYPTHPALNKVAHDVWYSVRDFFPESLLKKTSPVRNRLRSSILYSEDNEKPEMTKEARQYLKNKYENQVKGIEKIKGVSLSNWLNDIYR